MTGLRLVARTGHDLPPLWDGRRVEWKGWELTFTTAEIHAPKECCEGCGSTARHPSNVGFVSPSPGETFESWRSKKLPSGRVYDIRIPGGVPAWPILRLIAFRCPDCHLDTVNDRVTDEAWTLDASDYGDEGSADPRLF